MAASARIDVWDGWRGLAIMLVLIGHFTLSQWVWEERMGVDVFFVLSGMLMSNILFIDRMSLRDFYIRRLSRVIPALLVFLFFTYLIGVLLKYEFSIIELIASLFFIRTYFPVEPHYFTSPLPTGHLWSLSVEEHAYLMMSLMSVVMFTRGKIAWALMLVFFTTIVVNIYNYFNLDDQAFEYSLIRTEASVGFIAFSAAYNLIKKQNGIVLNPYAPLVLTLLAFLCYIDSMPLWMTFIFCPILLGLAINHLEDSATIIKRLLSFAPLRWMGIISYSVYLWQQVFYKLFYALPGKEFTGLVLSIVFGAASFYVLENPTRRYINRRWSANPSYRSTEPG